MFVVAAAAVVENRYIKYKQKSLAMSNDAVSLTNDARNRPQLYENILNGRVKDDKAAKPRMQNDHKDAETARKKRAP